MSNHHAGNPHRALHAETGPAPRHTNPHMPPAASAHFSTGAASANTQNSAASAHFSATLAADSATPAVPRRTPFRLTDARHLIQLRAGTPHTPHHAAPPRMGSATSRRALNPHMPTALAAPLPPSDPPASTLSLPSCWLWPSSPTSSRPRARLSTTLPRSREPTGSCMLDLLRGLAGAGPRFFSPGASRRRARSRGRSVRSSRSGAISAPKIALSQQLRP